MKSEEELIDSVFTRVVHLADLSKTHCLSRFDATMIIDLVRAHDRERAGKDDEWRGIETMDTTTGRDWFLSVEENIKRLNKRVTDLEQERAKR